MPVVRPPPGIAEEEPVELHKVPPREPDTGSLINDLGHYGGTHQMYRTEDLINLELKSVKAAVDLAKTVNLAQETQFLVARDILPDRDFRDGNGNAISGRAWRQPWSGHYESVETDLQMYRINRDCDYHNKVYVFWGIRYVNRGPADDSAVTSSSSITIKDSTNTFDIWQTETLDLNKEMYAFRPIIIKNYTEFSIYVRPKMDQSGTFDNYQILGRIIEPRGETIAGQVDK